MAFLTHYMVLKKPQKSM